MNKIVNALLSIAFVMYPLAVYFGIQHFEFKAFTILLGVMISLRLVFFRNKSLPWLNHGLLFYLVILVAATYFDTNIGMLFYPVFMNAALFSIFAYSLIQKPSVIETLARLQEPDLPVAGVRYTEKVTMVWCGFFLLNGALAFYTAQAGDMAWWGLYNGLISYLLMGTLMAVEWLVRQKVKAHHKQV